MNAFRFVAGAAGALATALALSAPVSALAADARLIVTYHAGRGPALTTAMSATTAARDAQAAAQRRLQPLAAHAGVALQAGAYLSRDAHLIKAQGISAEALAARLRSHPDVAQVAIDQRRRALRVPNDPLYTAGPVSTGPAVGQWYLKAPQGEVASAINAEAAWDRVLGHAGVVVAVLDTGVLAGHPDLAAAVLPGYDMIDDTATANDGNGRDADATDPGDWITDAEDRDRGGEFSGCGVANSSWHGTQVASIVAATGDNAVGMAGTAWGTRVLPVRVLGKCGGYDSDIIAGMRWAAGLSVPGVPTNPNPARIVNLSLGSSGACSESTGYPAVIRELNAAGVAVVVAAGNSVGHAVGLPGNCPGAIAVLGLRHAGSKVGFSDLGPQITIAAPGGNCVNIGIGEPCLYPILSATNGGTRSPLASDWRWTDSFDYAVGTSFAAPVVSGTLALMLAAQPALTPAEMKLGLQLSARAFPQTGAGVDEDGNPIQACRSPDGADQLQCYCNTSVCGAGMLDAAQAVARALGVQARFTASLAAPRVGQALSFDAGGSLVAPGRQIVSYAWQVTRGSAVSGPFVGPTNGATVSLNPVAPGSFTLELTLTDDQGQRSSAALDMTVAAAAEPPPADGGGGGGGAGMGLPWLMLLCVASCALLHARRAERRRARAARSR